MLTSECRTLALSKSQNQALARCGPQVQSLKESSTDVAAAKRRFGYRTPAYTHPVPHRGSERNRYKLQFLDPSFCPVCFSHYIAKSILPKIFYLFLDVFNSHSEIHRVYSDIRLLVFRYRLFLTCGVVNPVTLILRLTTE